MVRDEAAAAGPVGGRILRRLLCQTSAFKFAKGKSKPQKDFKRWDGVIPSLTFRRIAPAMVRERGRQSGYMWEQGLGLEMIVVVSLRRDDNDLWQQSGIEKR